MCLLAWYVFLSLHNGRFEGSMVSLWANTEQCVCVCVCVSRWKKEDVYITELYKYFTSNKYFTSFLFSDA